MLCCDCVFSGHLIVLNSINLLLKAVLLLKSLTIINWDETLIIRGETHMFFAHTDY